MDIILVTDDSVITKLQNYNINYNITGKQFLENILSNEGLMHKYNKCYISNSLDSEYYK